MVAFVEVTPETICRQRGTGKTTEIEILPDLMELAQQTCGELPMVIHGVELSIGSVHSWNDAYLRMLDSFQQSWPFVWHSEHLGFQTISGDNGATLEVGVPLPMPPTKEAASLVASRSDAILQRYGVPFLLENPAHYFSDLPTDPEIEGDIGLLHSITETSGCRLLLDLHNLYCNAVNHKFDPFKAIDRMRSTGCLKYMSQVVPGATATGWTLMMGVCRNECGRCWTMCCQKCPGWRARYSNYSKNTL